MTDGVNAVPLKLSEQTGPPQGDAALVEPAREKAQGRSAGAMQVMTFGYGRSCEGFVRIRA